MLTLFSKTPTSDILRVIHDFIARMPNTVVMGPSNGVTSIALRGSSGQIVFSFLGYQGPGDHFSKTILGMATWCRDSKGTDIVRKNAHDAVLNATSIVGVVATPELKVEDERTDLVFDIASSVDALIFTGDSVLAPDGTVLIDAAK